MTVSVEVNNKEYEMELYRAKQLLNHVYENDKFVTINGETMRLTMRLKETILRQLHEKVYV